MLRTSFWSAGVLATLALLGGVRTGGSAITSTPPTRAGDLSVTQVVLRVDPRRKIRINRLRSRIARPRRFPRALMRQVTPSLVVAAGAGELEPGTFVAAVALIHRQLALAAEGRQDVEARFVRAAVSLLLGVDLARTRGSVTFARAGDLLSTAPPASFCGGGLVPALVTALTSPVLHAEGAAVVPFTPGEILRSSLGLAFRACGQPLPPLLVAADIDRFAQELIAPSGATTTTLPEECDGTAATAPQTFTDPAYPNCTDLEWTTPIPDCADDLAFQLIDATTGQPIDALLFGHTSHVTYFFGLDPIRLVLHACNGESGSPGGGTTTLYAIVSWGG